MELFMPDYGACCLGSINLSEYVQNREFNFDEFGCDVRTCVSALDTVLEDGLDLHALPQQKETAQKWRQIGLGFFGLADALIKLGIKYGSNEAVDFAETVTRKMYLEAFNQSVDLAETHGCYPACDIKQIKRSEFYGQILRALPGYKLEKFERFGMRNATLLALAPTGSIATMLDVSTSIEPLFSTEYTRTTKTLHGEDKTYTIYPKVISDIKAMHSTGDGYPDYVITAGKIPYPERLAMQAAIQQWVDSSISSTVNLPNSATVEDVENLYLDAWGMGLKGVTVFRDGCLREGILKTTDDTKSEPQELSATIEHTVLGRGDIICSDDTLIGRKRKLTTGCGSLHVVAFFEETTGDLMEVFLSKGSEGGCGNSLTGISRMISIASRGGIAFEDILDQLRSAGTCPSYATRRAMKGDTSKGSSCPVAIANALEDMYAEILSELTYEEEDDAFEVRFVNISDDTELTRMTVAPLKATAVLHTCPECGEPMERRGGCWECDACGASLCE